MIDVLLKRRGVYNVSVETGRLRIDEMVTKFTVNDKAGYYALIAWMLLAIFFSAPEASRAQSFISDPVNSAGLFSYGSSSFGLSSPTDISFSTSGMEPLDSSPLNLNGSGTGSAADSSVGTDLLIGGIIVGTIVLVDSSSSHHSSQSTPAPESSSLEILSVLLATGVGLATVTKLRQIHNAS